VEHESDLDIEHQLWAAAGLLMLPVLLKDDSLYSITTLEVIVYIVIMHVQNCDASTT